MSSTRRSTKPINRFTPADDDSRKRARKAQVSSTSSTAMLNTRLNNQLSDDADDNDNSAAQVNDNAPLVDLSFGALLTQLTASLNQCEEFETNDEKRDAILTAAAALYVMEQRNAELDKSISDASDKLAAQNQILETVRDQRVQLDAAISSFGNR